MNNDLVSRSALKKELSLYPSITKFNSIHDGILAEIIDNVPTVDFEKLGESLNCQIRATYGSCDDCLLSCPRNELIKLLGLAKPQGEWVVQRLQNGFEDVYCPFCNARPTRSEYGYYLKDRFCHDCGAKMKGGAE